MPCDRSQDQAGRNCRVRAPQSNSGPSHWSRTVALGAWVEQLRTVFEKPGASGGLAESGSTLGRVWVPRDSATGRAYFCARAWKNVAHRKVWGSLEEDSPGLVLRGRSLSPGTAGASGEASGTKSLWDRAARKCRRKGGTREPMLNLQPIRLSPPPRAIFRLSPPNLRARSDRGRCPFCPPATSQG